MQRGPVVWASASLDSPVRKAAYWVLSGGANRDYRGVGL